MEQKVPIRVAQVLNRMDSGGIEAVVMNYYREIDRSKVQFDFYFAQDSEFPQREELEKLGAGIYPIPAYTKVKEYQKVLYDAFCERKYNIVHTHLNTMAVFPLFAAWRADVPVRICHNHSTAHWGEGKRTLLKYLLRPFAKTFATDYFACGEKAGRWMYGSRLWDRGLVRIMPNAIDAEKFSFDQTARNSLRKELNIAEDAFVVGNVGRFVYPKNHAELIEIFSAVKQKKPNAVLLLVGEGELQQKIQQKVKALGLENSVVFTGVRKDVNKLYSVMDVFCLPSFYEGLPVVGLEAQANGLPTLCSDQVSKETAVTPQVQFIGLEDREGWENAILQSKRCQAIFPGNCKIQNAAHWLETFYMEECSARKE